MTTAKEKQNGTAERAAEDPAPHGRPQEEPLSANPQPPSESFPCRKLEDAAHHLRRPFTPEAIHFRLLSGQTAAGYITARQVIERLNLVVPGLWFAQYEHTQGGLLCHLTIKNFNPRFDITRTDVGQGKGPKDLISDSLKRAAVHFGVGVSIYALATPWVKEEKYLRKYKVQGKEKLALSKDGEAWLRDRYRAWLSTDAGKNFGTPLDHGDVEGAAPQEEVPEPEQGGELTPAYLIDQQADDLRNKCRDAYELLKERGGARKLPPGQFGSALAAASTSHDALREFCDQVKEITASLEDTP